jgi:hypothetical protein
MSRRPSGADPAIMDAASVTQAGTRDASDGTPRLRRAGDGWNAEHRGERPMQRADRNFNELLQELRVTQTGVQILFAFLLGLAFTPRFAALTAVDRTIYVVTLVSSAVTTALLIAPVAAHRLQFQYGRKVQLVRLVHRCLLAGLTTLLVTMVGAILLVLDVVVGAPVAGSVTGAVASGFVVLWFALPAYLRVTGARSPDRSGRAGRRGG